jgi:hypothetical protein
VNNREVMERFGYRICAECNSDMPAVKFVGDRCQYCKDDEPTPSFIVTRAEKESSYDRIRRGIDEHDAWKKERNSR